MFDGLVAASLLACGLGLWRRLPGTGRLMVATGLAWLLGDLSGWLVFVHRGPLVHLLTAYPRARPRGTGERVLILAAYLDAIVYPLGHWDVATVVLTAAWLAVLLHRYRTASAAARRAMTTPALAGTVLGGLLAIGAAARILNHPVDHAVLVGYQTVLTVIPVALYADARWGRWSAAAVDRLVVELGGAVERTPLRDRLATVLGDPSLVIGYPASGGGLVDESGRQLGSPRAGQDRTVTTVRDAAQVVAVLVHDRAVLDDPQLLDSVARLTRLALANIHLHAEAQAAIEELESSRRRLLTVADAERECLAAEVDAGALARLRRVDALLADSLEDAQLRRQLRDCVAALADFARGVHPRTLTEHGLRAALVELAAAAPLPLTLDVEQATPTADAEIDAAAYFVCAEALTNIAKYAWAASASVQVRTDGAALRVDVVDDGAGGADPAAGSGLRGLADRLDVLGGTLTVHSSPGGGTRVTGLIPLRRPVPPPAAGNAG